MRLFAPAWTGQDEKKALAYIEKCRDQEKLETIAREAPSIARRVAAINRITDTEVLLRAAHGGDAFYKDSTLSDSVRKAQARRGSYVDEDCQEAAIARIGDPKQLYELAKRGIHRPWRCSDTVLRSLVRRLRDAATPPETLAGDTSVDFEMRAVAVESVESQDFLMRLAEKEYPYNKKRPTVWLPAVRKVRDPGFRKGFCEKEQTHEWERLDRDVKQIGDTRYITDNYRCRYCGKEKAEEESYRF